MNTEVSFSKPYYFLNDGLRLDIAYSKSAMNLWAKKATGLGITEFMLRIMAWLCTSGAKFGKSQMCIVTGPNIDIATKLIKRLKGIFDTKLGLTFHKKETVQERSVFFEP